MKYSYTYHHVIENFLLIVSINYLHDESFSYIKHNYNIKLISLIGSILLSERLNDWLFLQNVQNILKWSELNTQSLRFAYYFVKIRGEMSRVRMFWVMKCMRCTSFRVIRSTYIASHTRVFFRMSFPFPSISLVKSYGNWSSLQKYFFMSSNADSRTVNGCTLLQTERHAI